ncbi:MAG: hypothetical protein EXS59_01690 [Candidatus Taylorbacteria bacterium]|nr:hypothetical protein [Candidatus Taylorbacteria bacterium]
MSKNVLSADNQQERVKVKLDPWYITGFVEGEGTFHVALYIDPHMKTKLKVIPEFHVNQSYLRIITLEKIQEYFGCGYLKKNHGKNPKDTTYVYVVRDRKELVKKIIPFFQKYQLKSVKQESFTWFAKIVGMMVEGKHRTSVGARRIIDLAYKMNVSGKYRFRTKNQLLKLLQSSETTR